MINLILLSNLALANHMVEFYRREPPGLEICWYDDSEIQSYVQLSTIYQAVGFTKAVGAQWKWISLSDCKQELTSGDVRLEMSRLAPPKNTMELTSWVLDDQGYADKTYIYLFPFKNTDSMLIISHELLHSQGASHSCKLTEEGREKLPVCSEANIGDLMFPSYNYIGFGTHGIKKNIESVYSK